MSKRERSVSREQIRDNRIVNTPCDTPQPNLFTGPAPALNIIGTPKHRCISSAISRSPLKEQIYGEWEIDSLQRNQTFYDYAKQNMGDCWEAHADKLVSLDQYIKANWLDHIIITKEGVAEFYIEVLDMVSQRVHMIESHYIPGRCLKPYLFFSLVCIEFLRESDQDYVKVISELMENVVAKRKGRVLVIKGVADTDMRPVARKNLEYHWVPEGVGEGFKP